MTRETTELISAALEGTILPTDFAKLQEILRSDPTALAHYCEQAEIHGRLEWELKDTALSDQSSNSSKSSKILPFRLSQTQIASIAAVILVAAITSFTLFHKTSTTPAIALTDARTPEAKASAPLAQLSPSASIARITNTHAARWQDDSLQIGSWLRSGTVHLLSGEAEITFNSGARVVLNGPAELKSLTPHLACLRKGKGVVHIPHQAEGFRLSTPYSSFSDQECSFALAVDDTSTEIHVFKGSIESSPSNNAAASSTLTANQSMRLTSSSVLPVDSIRYASNTFQSELPIASDQQAAEYLRWSFDSIELDYFPETGNHEQARFPAKIEQLADSSGDYHAQTLKGKFGRAIRFDGEGAYLSTEFPGIPGASERTISCWVRIPKNAQSRHAYSLFSWGEPNSQTGTKWQVAWNAAFENSGTYGALRTEFGGGYVIGSTNLLDGQWHHITSVYLGGNTNDVTSQVLHYIDGRLESVSAHKQQTINTEAADTRTRYAFIGKRLENDSQFSSFKGDIDELHVFPAALTPAQIENLRLHNQTPESFIRNLAQHTPRPDH